MQSGIGGLWGGAGFGEAVGREKSLRKSIGQNGIFGDCMAARAKPTPRGVAGSTVDQNWAKTPCRGRPFGLKGELTSEIQNRNSG